MQKKLLRYLAIAGLIASTENTASLAWASGVLNAPAVAKYAPAPGSHRVMTWTAEWKDTARNRTIPVKIYYPSDIINPVPVILFSHGLGGSRDGYRYLGEYWAAHGYVSVHLQHPGSDDAVWKEGDQPARNLAAAAADLRNAIDRPLDVQFVLDRLTALRSDPAFPLHGKLNLERIGTAGHSFGAYTTLALAGQKFRAAAADKLAEPRFRAAIAMSPPVQDKTLTSDTYAGIAIPLFVQTGTKDTDMFGNADPSKRRVPYDQMKKAPADLLILKDGDHMVFSGERRRGDSSQDDRFHQLILESTTAFWDANLREDDAARQWLEEGGFMQRLGASGTFEHKDGLTKR